MQVYPVIRFTVLSFHSVGITRPLKSSAKSQRGGFFLCYNTPCVFGGLQKCVKPPMCVHVFQAQK